MLQPQTPAVSIVLCTFNGEPYLPQQMDSILAQTHPLHEIVVVDDGSTDGTWPLLEKYAAKHPFIRLYRNEQNLGYNKNFEKALCLATGEVLAIADQDDVWRPEKIATLLQVLPESCPLVYCDSIAFSDVPPPRPVTNPLIDRIHGTNPRPFAIYNTISGHAMIIRRSLLRLALPFNPGVYYDWWLAMVALCNGGVAYCPEILVFHRHHGANASLPENVGKKIELANRRQLVLRHLMQFEKTPNMHPADHSFFVQLCRLWKAALDGQQKKELFLFLMKHRHQVYASKARKLAFFSHLKRSYRYAFAKK